MLHHLSINRTVFMQHSLKISISEKENSLTQQDLTLTCQISEIE